MEQDLVIDKPQTPEQGERREIGMEFLQNSLKEHEEFDDKIWRKDNPDRKSFHEVRHIEAVFEISDKIDDAYINNQEVQEIDPFYLMEDINKWNELNSVKFNVSLTPELFKDIRRAAVAEHDKGNIASGLDENGKPIYRQEGYTAAGAEQVAIEIYKQRIDETDLDDEMKELYKNVGGLLIEGTISGKDFMTLEEAYNEDRDPPQLFRRYIAAMDQIGNDSASENNDRLEGLAEENKAEAVRNNRKAEVKVDFFENFALERMPVIIKDQEKQEMAWKLLGGKPDKKRIPNYLRGDVPADIYIDYRQKISAINEYTIRYGEKLGLTDVVKGKLRKELGIDADKVLGEMESYDKMKPENLPQN